MSKRVSLTDVAKKAGVSIATASYALNGSSEVSEKTRRRIMAIAQELDYHPNKAAQGLRTSQSKMVCMLINTFNSIFNGELVDDIRELLEPYGYSLVVIGNSTSDLIDSQLFDGLIIWNYKASQARLEQLIQRAQIPIVLMANELTFPNVDNIVIDNYHAIQKLFRYYERSEHKRICFFTNNHTSYNSEKRLQSCADYMAKYHPEVDVAQRTFNGKFEVRRAYILAKKLLQQGAYDFFFCLNDMMAYGVYQAADELGLKVGEDLSVVGFDNSPKSGEVYKPKLTTVDARIESWGKTVVTSLVHRLQASGTLMNQTIYTPTRIINGDSVKLIQA
ncbi:LacI family DNA-binding transcriptional regulator [Lacticaseibacillus sp. GG6-2]